MRFLARLPLLLALVLVPCAAHAQLVSSTSGAPAPAETAPMEPGPPPPADPGTPDDPAPPETPRTPKLRVFLDFVGWPADPDFYRQELPFVNHVRTRYDADVHVQISHRRTASGGAEVTLRFLGRNRFEGETFGIVLFTRPTDTSDLARRAIAKRLKLGLARFVAATADADRLTVHYEGERVSAVPQGDPWNGWIAQTSVYGYFTGESQTEYTNLYASGSVSRVTTEWKNSLHLSSSYDERTYRYSSVDDAGNPVELRFTSIGRSHNANARSVKSLGPRAAAAVTVYGSRSSYTNKALELGVSAGFEVSAWPYSESTSRLLVFRYWLGAKDSRYDEETIFLKEREQLVVESGHILLRLTQPWGSVSGRLSGSHYLHDVSKNQASVGGNMDVRIARGLALNLNGSLALIRDQIYLPAAGASPEEILLQRKQLATDYQYSLSVGLTYTFGSIYSNVVNPRFD